MSLAGFFIKTAYVCLQCTWGIVQTCGGMLLFLRFIKAPHEMYHGAIYTKWNLNQGISLGLFIFTPDKEEEWRRRMAVHEYGHTWQSLLLGPFYLVLVGIPSIVWCRSEKCIRLRREKNLPYSCFYTERWADRLGERMEAWMKRI